MSELRDPLDEATLRRALRLESYERAPRFDPAAIAAAASATRPRGAVLAGGLVLAALAGAAAGGIWSTLLDAAPWALGLAGTAVLSLVISLATALAPIAAAAAQPAVPISLLAALALAILHEVREGRGHAHAIAS